MLYFTQERNAQIGFHLDYKFNFDTPFGDKFVSARQKTGGLVTGLGRTQALDFREPLTWSRTQNDFGDACPLNSGKNLDLKSGERHCKYIE